MTAPPCLPDTLGDVCTGGCGRRLHHGRPRGTSAAACQAGHPRRASHGMCGSCCSTQRRKEKPRVRAETRKAAVKKPVAEKVPMPALTHSYCPHDEGERCDCEVAA